MSYVITNASGGTVVAGGLTWRKGESKTLNLVNQDIIDAVEVKHTLSSDTDLTPLGGLADIVNGQNILVAGNGTPAAPVSGTRTLVATTDQTTTNNAIAALVAELNLARTAIGSLIARVEVLENVLVVHELNFERSSIAG